MVYNWEGKEAECYRLYVEEKKSLDEVMEVFRAEGFNPSKRAFQTQFKRWDFPSKQNPAHKNAALVARVKELWEKNTSQKEMLIILSEEGLQIKERELMRVRAKNRWLLRVPNGMKSALKPASGAQSGVQSQNIMQELEQAIMEENANADEAKAQAEKEGAAVQRPSSPELDPEVIRKRQQRLERLQAESDERWRTRKRRRRTRGWAGMPADPEGPPRFPSETTIDESKAYLNMDNDLYRQVREQFQSICEEEGVLKKTIAGPDKWTEVKDRLIRENAHLQNVFWNDPQPHQQNGQPSKHDQKALSLDVICTDVTKRMRTLECRMTIAEAKNALSINPEESRQIRHAFYATLKADHFTSKLEAGDSHWNELKEQWIAESDLLQRILAPGDADPNHELKKKALEVLCRDVMKRHRDDQTKRDPTRKKQINTGPGPGPAPPSINSHALPRSYSSTTNIVIRQEQHENNNQPQTQPQPLSHPSDLQIDPSLLLAANDPSVMQGHHDTYPPPYADPGYASASHAQAAVPAPIPVYFRLHPHSSLSLGAHSKQLWLGALQIGTVAEIRSLAMREHPGTIVVRIEGVVTHRGGEGHSEREMVYAIDDEAELGGYLAHVAGGKVTFVVMLAPAAGQGESGFV
ncbi:hypothetical protein V2W45_1248331 [Cenococcum geophilum]